MSSSGAQHITIENGRIAGSVRFESMRAAAAFGFRLKLEFRVSLDAIAELGRYALTDLDGELSVGDRAVGRLHPHGSRLDVSCKPQAVDCPVVLVVDVEPWVLDRMEEQRNGGEPSFRVDLSPRLEREDGRRVRAWIQTFPIPVSRDAWLRILEQLGHELLQAEGDRLQPPPLVRPEQLRSPGRSPQRSSLGGQSVGARLGLARSPIGAP